MGAVQACRRRPAKKKWTPFLPTSQPRARPSPLREILLSHNDIHVKYWKYARRSNASTLLCKNWCGVIDSRTSVISTMGGRPESWKFSHKPYYTEGHNFSNITPNCLIFLLIDIFAYPLSAGSVERIKYAPQKNLGLKEATSFSVSGWIPLRRGPDLIGSDEPVWAPIIKIRNILAGPILTWVSWNLNRHSDVWMERTDGPPFQ